MECNFNNRKEGNAKSIRKTISEVVRQSLTERQKGTKKNLQKID